jgi:hypothetical protein
MSDLLQLEDASGILLHENGDRMLLEDGIPFRPFVGAEPFVVSTGFAPVGFLLGRVVAASPFVIQVGIIDLELARAYELEARPFLVRVGMGPLGLLSGRVLNAASFILNLSWADSDVLRGAGVGAEPFEVQILVAPGTMIRGYIFYLDAFVLNVSWADSQLLRNAWLGGDPFQVELNFDAELKLERRRSEIGWDTALQPGVDACRSPLADELHPVGESMKFGTEALHPPVKGSGKALSDATHPKATRAVQFGLPRKNC